ncbi:MAG: glycoside hydrolase family 3 C-terminal domain-containing protein [Anaerolineae bacterium]|nr:glycoside hydrolase family 3 C-terminal domain-containing protein [Anaerolineae bacterium]
MTDAQPLFRNPDKPLDQRISDLIAQLTIPEKCGQLMNAAPAIPRLGIPAYNYWSEGLHGVARNGRATVFPQAIGLASMWDTERVEQIGAAIADEARAKHQAVVEQFGDSLQDQGLHLWSPNINIFRDPRWGRGQETYGEDPYLTGEIGVAFVRGLQGDSPHYLKTAACAKHFAVHSGPEAERHGFNAQVSPRDLHDTYLPAFERLVRDGRVEAVMGAYNRTNGEPCCANTVLIHTLREDWQFAGHFVSDCGALGDFHNHHHVTADAVESAALALRVGCDLECGEVYRHLPEALQRGLISEADLDWALTRVLASRFKLGLFDPPERVPYTAISMDVVNSEAHQRLAYDASVRSMVLLKNNGILPLKPDLRTMYVTGPNAASLDALLGNYAGYSDTMTTFLEGIIGRAPSGMKIRYGIGCTLDRVAAHPRTWSITQAAHSDVTIACMGYSPLMESEEGDALLSSGDRKEIGLPAAQVTFLKYLADAGAKIVLVLCGGGPIALGEIESLVEAVIMVWYPGQAGGTALADVLWGDVSPSGKLPVTFPQSLDQLPPFENYNMAGRTYRYMTEEPLYPFGFGLSYNRFQLDQLQLDQPMIRAGESLRFAVHLKNVSNRAGEDVVQVYLSDLEASVPVPIHKLVAFRRVSMSPNETRRLEFIIPAEHMMLVDESGNRQLEPGIFRLTVGSCLPGSRGVALGVPEPVTAEFTVI